MKPDGVIAFHVTNRYLDLVPVVEGIAHELDLHTLWINDDGELPLANSSSWVLVAKDPGAAVRPAAHGSRHQHQCAPRLARLDRRLQQPAPGAEVAHEERRSRALSRAGAPARRAPRRRDRPARAAAHAGARQDRERGCRSARHPQDVDSRRTAHRRGRRLRPRARARSRRVGRRARRAHSRRSTPRGRPPSTCAGRSSASARRSRRLRVADRADAAWAEADAIVAEDVGDEPRDRRARHRASCAASRSGGRDRCA